MVKEITCGSGRLGDGHVAQGDGGPAPGGTGNRMFAIETENGVSDAIRPRLP